VLRQFSEIKEYAEMGAMFTVTFANGELLVNKYFDGIMEVLADTKWKIEIISNLSIYREKLASLMETGRIVSVLTSIDAGTRETFKRIKKNDRFDVVIENLRKYPVHKTKLYLKYLFVEGLNDNETDVDGYYEIVKEVGAIIMLSSDKFKNSKPFTENERFRALTTRIIQRAKSDGINFIPDPINSHPQDVMFINSFRKT